MALDTNQTETSTQTSTTTTPAPGNNITTITDGLDKLPENMTNINAEETLQNSELTKIDLNNTKATDIKATFCREIGHISSRYEVKTYSINDNLGFIFMHYV